MRSEKLSRKKFVLWGVGISSVFVVPTFLKFTSAKKHKTTTEKMLTQDGRLVEINVADIPAERKKIKKSDISTWIHGKTL
jgi:hypothetical protein